MPEIEQRCSMNTRWIFNELCTMQRQNFFVLSNLIAETRFPYLQYLQSDNALGKPLGWKRIIELELRIEKCA